MRILLNHDMKNIKNGITIFSDIGMVFQFSNDIHCGNDDNIHRILEYEKSVPTKYNDLGNSDLYRQKDYECILVPTVRRRSYLIVILAQFWS